MHKLLLLIGLAFSFNAMAMTANEVMSKVYHVNHFYSFKNFPLQYQPKGEVTIVKKSQGKTERVMKVDRYLKMNNKEGVIAKEVAFFKTGNSRGVGMLMVERANSKYRDYYYWMPALRKVKRMPQPHHEQSWGGTDFSYADVELRKVHDEKHELVGEAILEGCLGEIEGIAATNMDLYNCMNKDKPVYLVKSTPLKEYSYDYRVTYVDQVNFGDYRSLYYKNGKHVKTVEKNWMSHGMPDPLAIGWNYWYGKNELNQHESMAIMQQEGIVFEKESMDAGFWRLSTLRKFKR